MQGSPEEIKLDPWQEEVLNHKGDLTIRAGRQVGKSFVIALKVREFATANPGTVTLVIAASQRQASYLFGKIKGFFDEEDRVLVGDATENFMQNLKVKRNPTKEERSVLTASASIYKGQPTQTRIELKNGSIIYCLPTGKTGVYIRGYTCDLIIADEAAYIAEPVWLSIVPMLVVSREKRGFGNLILLSTPFGKGGFFYESFNDPDFRQFHVSSENCSRISKKFLLKERKRLSKIEYAQEYLGEFVEEWNQFFSTKLLMKCATFIEWEFEKDYRPGHRYYLGVDFARYGGDENAFVVSEMDNNGNLRIVKAETTERVATTDTIGRIRKMDEKFQFRKILVDDGGIGGAITDDLIEIFGRKVVGLNNSSRSIDKDDRKKRILKEDLYSNMLVLLEHFETGQKPHVQLIADIKLLGSLKSMTFEYTREKNLLIYGKVSHLAEAAVRACWAIKEKGLKLFCY